MEKKPIRNKGKLQLSRYFQKFENGNFVAIVKEISLQPRFPKRLQGQVGIIEGKKGKAYIVKIKNKRFLIEPIHLKKIKSF
jgi:large subunit ribosomal protein L21e